MIGIDVSHWQGLIDWAKVRQEADFAIMKCSQGVTILDGMYQANKAGAVKYAIPHGAYHYFLADTDGVKQADWFVKCAADTSMEVWVIDVENPGVGLVYNLKYMIDRMISNTGCTPVIYTSPGFWNYNVKQAYDWANQCPLWVAHYTTNPAPTLPIGWKKWAIWQYTAKGVLAGINPVDLDKFNGTDYDLLMFFGNGVIDYPDPEPIPDTLLFEALVEGQNVRTGPGLSYPKIGALSIGQVLAPLDIAGLDAWAEIAPGQWVAVKIGTKRYLRAISE
jgi:lysozyme